MVRHTPLVSIDLLGRDAQGGRIDKDERIAAAFIRLTTIELGAAFSLEEGRFVGVFEHFYPAAHRWLSDAEILADPDVHKNTKAYCR